MDALSGLVSQSAWMHRPARKYHGMTFGCQRALKVASEVRQHILGAVVVELPWSCYIQASSSIQQVGLHACSNAPEVIHNSLLGVGPLSSQCLSAL